MRFAALNCENLEFCMLISMGMNKEEVRCILRYKSLCGSIYLRVYFYYKIIIHNRAVSALCSVKL